MIVQVRTHDAAARLHIEEKNLLVVLCIERTRSNTNYFLLNDRLFAIPYKFDSKDFAVIDKTVPEDWVVSNYDENSFETFEAWASDKNFYSYLIEDEWKPDKTKEATKIIWEKYCKYISDYAAYKYETTANAKLQILRRRYEQKVALYEERGYESPGEFQPSTAEIENTLITIDDITHMT